MEKVDFKRKSVGTRNSFAFWNLEVRGVLFVLERGLGHFFSKYGIC